MKTWIPVIAVLAFTCTSVLAQDKRNRTEAGAGVERGMIVEILQQPAASPGAEVSIALPVTFAFASADLSPQGRSILDTTALALNSPELAALTFTIEGHTDSVGGDQANLLLSQRRAEAAKAYLAQQGVATGRLTAVGYGESRHIPGAASTDGRQRRVEIVRRGQ